MGLQKELLYALLGHTGRVVVASADDGTFELARGLPLQLRSLHALSYAAAASTLAIVVALGLWATAG